MSPAAALRARLMAPPNARWDDLGEVHGIDIRTGERKPPTEPVEKVLLESVREKPKLVLTHPAPPYVWPGDLCGEFWLPFEPISVERPVVTIKAIIIAVAAVFEVGATDILSQRRLRRFIIPRHAGMAIAKRLTLHSYPEIGRRFGGRDHTTVLSAVRKMMPHIEAVAADLKDYDTVTAWAVAMKARLEG